MAAIGCALIAADEARQPSKRHHVSPFQGMEPLRTWLTKSEYIRNVLAPLSAANAASATMPIVPIQDNCEQATMPVPVDMGIDVGSITTKAAVINDNGDVLARCYQLTRGRPLESARQALAEVGREVKNQVTVIGVGTTGSGRYLTPTLQVAM